MDEYPILVSAGMALADRFHPIPAADPQIRNGPLVERRRLSDQCWSCLMQFKRPASRPDLPFQTTNGELAKVSLKYTSRISDLRRAGHKIAVVRRDRKTGSTTYQWNGGPL